MSHAEFRRVIAAVTLPVPGWARPPRARARAPGPA
jgi:hypothetical protein